jgi:hypothetical protein
MKRAEKKSRRVRRQRGGAQRGGAQQDVQLYMLRDSTGAMKNFISTDSTVSLTAAGSDAVNIITTRPIANLKFLAVASNGTAFGAPVAVGTSGTSIQMSGVPSGTTTSKTVRLPAWTAATLGTELKLTSSGSSFTTAGLKVYNLNTANFGTLSSTGITLPGASSAVNICIVATVM